MSYSKSIYFIPVRFSDFSVFTKTVGKCGAWDEIPPEERSVDYFLSYATRIAKDRSLYRLYKCKEIPNDVHMHTDRLEIKHIPVIEDVRLSCFATGIGFMEFWVNYTDMTPEEIYNFAYRFKKAEKDKHHAPPEGERALYDVALSLLPDNARATLFFTAAAGFKRECNCYHFLHLDEAEQHEDAVKNRLFHLCRSYKEDIPIHQDSDYDMVYTPSSGDYWAGCTEGLVNVVYDANHKDENGYLHRTKPAHLQKDYYFMYLLLLNQKFSAVEYIDQISLLFDSKSSALEKLNQRIVRLKTVFSFNVISDDKAFQNVYSKMYDILKIKQLLEDIVDNESQMEMLQNADAVKAGKRSDKFLFGLSLLSLFSALIDASSFFDRWPQIRQHATTIAIVCVCGVVALTLARLFRRS